MDKWSSKSSPRAVSDRIELFAGVRNVSLASIPNTPLASQRYCCSHVLMMSAVSGMVAWCGRCPLSARKRRSPICKVVHIPALSSLLRLCWKSAVCTIPVPRHSAACFPAIICRSPCSSTVLPSSTITSWRSATKGSSKG